MKLMIIIVQEDDAHELAQNLNKHAFLCTKISSKGGFLRRGNTTFLVGTTSELTESVIGIVKTSCKRRKTMFYTSPGMDGMNGLSIPQGVEIETGGANIFVLNMDQASKL